MNWKTKLAAGAILLSGILNVQASDFATFTCLAPNGGFYIDGTNFTVLVQGQTEEVAVLPEGSLVQLWSCGWDDGCKLLPYDVQPNSVWEIVNVGGAKIILQQVVPVIACAGFEPPMANYPVSVKKNRSLPLKAELFDSEDFPVLGDALIAPPVLQVWFERGTAEADDVSDDALPAGQGTEGNQFVFTDDGKWQFNLKTSNYLATGTYTVFMESGDSSEYLFGPSCTTEFIVK